MGSVKQMLACCLCVVVAACSEDSARVAEPQQCLVVTRPEDPTLVVERGDRVLRRPLLRAACAKVAPGLVAWADKEGVHVEVGGVIHHAAPGPTALGTGCLVGLVLGNERALVQGADGGVVVVDGGGARPFTLPELAPGERVVGLGREGIAIRGPGRKRRVASTAPPGERVLRVGDVVVGKLTGTTATFEGGAQLDVGNADGLTLRGGAVITNEGDSVRAFLAGKEVPLPSHGGAHTDGKRIFQGTCDGKWIAYGEGGEAEVILDVASSPSFPLGDAVRERVSIVAADDGDLLIAERLREPDCSVRDRLSLRDADGAVRVLADGPSLRAPLYASEGVLAYVESRVSYDAGAPLSGERSGDSDP